jgi:hypothetical protein
METSIPDKWKTRECLAHQVLSRWKKDDRHLTDPGDSEVILEDLMDFARAIEREALERAAKVAEKYSPSDANGRCPLAESIRELIGDTGP